MADGWGDDFLGLSAGGELLRQARADAGLSTAPQAIPHLLAMLELLTTVSGHIQSDPNRAALEKDAELVAHLIEVTKDMLSKAYAIEKATQS